MENLLNEIRNCKVCEEHFPHGCNPIISASEKSKIVIIGQAPGRKVHDSNIPWNDKSGDNLRDWLGVDKETFYNPDNFAIVGMGFCYPGTGKSGDLPPRKECAPLWHPQLHEEMNDVKLTILIGQYAQKYYLGKQAKRTLTETVEYYHEYLPKFFVLPHPSPRNNIWQAKNRWFPSEVLPELTGRVNSILQ
ncbi:uracil-DNA glycosylase family protein [Brumimicrobium oceani]|uniref:IclR family transcriptional regulator n=1 Tax=Brumimicrobium oceani TaxID=2100725 RepID=A0A2U2XF13_9FLAO|nr:uracil-DNA glycosylase family protein [Brumimicrobium oceani]PWH86389.1 IclR family transcriptional regulator [Brumimicrobium oceani]